MDETPVLSAAEIEQLLTQKRATKKQLEARLEAKQARDSQKARRHRTHLLIKIAAEFCKQCDYLSIEDLEELAAQIDNQAVMFYPPDLK